MYIPPSVAAEMEQKHNEQQEAKNERSDLLFWWRVFEKIPLIGRWLFGFFLGLFIPYSGGIKCRIIDLQPGYALLLMKDRWHLRNHIGSIHAAALSNLLELTSGLSLHTLLPENQEAIIYTLSTHFANKGRGTLLAECVSAEPQEGPYQNSVAIIDEDARLVASGKGFWQVRAK